MIISRHISRLRKFRKQDEGAALVEFAIILPLMLLAFFTIVEFSRLFFSYQGALAGVRDATRYLARTQDERICVTDPSGSNYTTYTQSAWNSANASTTDGDTPNTYYGIVWRNMRTEAASELPANVELNQIQYRHFCEAGTGGGFRQALVPMAELRAQFTVTMPLVGILEINGQPLIDPIVRVIVDQSRIYGT